MNNINIINGNIFNSHAQTIVNTVNCVGVMGKGIALVFKLRYPKMFDIYKKLCSAGEIQIGKLWLYRDEPAVPWVLNFPTKYHWKYPSKMEYIELGLKKFLSTYKGKGISSIAFPLLGTFNGGLNKNDVLNLMVKYLSLCDIPVEIYEYNPLVADDLFDSFKLKWMLVSESNEVREKTRLSKKQVKAITEAILSEDVKSMVSLLECDGVGVRTLEKCFKLVLKGFNGTEQNLFGC
jgi:O-acetyl-ADP-ribose deacetylase (regulator of RNase III)